MSLTYNFCQIKTVMCCQVCVEAIWLGSAWIIDKTIGDNYPNVNSVCKLIIRQYTHSQRDPLLSLRQGFRPTLWNVSCKSVKEKQRTVTLNNCWCCMFTMSLVCLIMMQFYLFCYLFHNITFSFSSSVTCAAPCNAGCCQTRFVAGAAFVTCCDYW